MNEPRKILVVDFGSQVSHLIARRIRQLGVRADLVYPDIKAEEVKKLRPWGIILSGGPASVYDKGSPTIDAKILKLGIPVLGICYGKQLIAHLLGGKVVPGRIREFGHDQIQITAESPLFAGLAKVQDVWYSHGDYVSRPPKGFRTVAESSNGLSAAFEKAQDKIYGVQFHPEQYYTKEGRKILKNFVFTVCKARKNWDISDVKKILLKDIRKKVRGGHVLVAVSGGVDSTCVAMLLKEAIGERLHAVTVDHGLFRKREVEEVQRLLSLAGLLNYEVIDAKDKFLGKLDGVRDPEEKRRLIGQVFWQLFSEYAKRLQPRPGFFAQGTLYPDRVESGITSRHAERIKSHHNVVPPPKDFKLKLIEPLAELYKDEVRALGALVGVPKEILRRHPFPGPGLAVRVVDQPFRSTALEIVREADSIFIQALEEHGYYERLWQALAAILPGKAVGVKGDAREYGRVIALRAVTSKDAMSADWAKLPPFLLQEVAARIFARVSGVTRVLYDVSQKPPSTIEYE